MVLPGLGFFGLNSMFLVVCWCCLWFDHRLPYLVDVVIVGVKVWWVTPIDFWILLWMCGLGFLRER